MIGPLILGHCCMRGVVHWWNCIAASVAVVVVVVASAGSVGGILPRFMV